MKARHPNAERLAEAISARRAAQHWSHRRVSRQGGPSKPTQMNYEHGDIPRTVSSDVLERFDIGLGWESGTALKILGGGAVPDPHSAVITQTGAVAEPEPERDPDEDDFTEWLSQKTLQIMNVQTELRRRILSQIPDVPQEVKEVVDEATALQAEILMEQVQHQQRRSKKGASSDNDDEASLLPPTRRAPQTPAARG